MSKLENLTPRAAVRGILPGSLITVVSVQWFGSEALELTYKTPEGRVANELLYRHDEARIEVVEQGRPWSFDGDGSLLRLVSEAHRILSLSIRSGIGRPHVVSRSTAAPDHCSLRIDASPSTASIFAS